MFVEKVKNNNIEYLRLCESVSTPGVKGGRKKCYLRGTPFLMSRIWVTSQSSPPFLLHQFDIY